MSIPEIISIYDKLIEVPTFYPTDNIQDSNYFFFFNIDFPIIKGIDTYGRKFYSLKLVINGKIINKIIYQRFSFNNYYWIECGQDKIFESINSSLNDKQINLIINILKKKEPIIQISHEPINKKLINKKIFLYYKKKWKAAIKIQKAWRICRYNPIFKMCEKVQMTNLQEITY